MQGAGLPAAVRFPYTFSDVGLVLLESVAVFRYNGTLLTTSGGGSTGRRRLAAAPATAVVIAQRAQFDLPRLAAGSGDAGAGGARTVELGAADAAPLTAAFASGTFFSAPAPQQRETAPLWTTV